MFLPAERGKVKEIKNKKSKDCERGLTINMNRQKKWIIAVICVVVMELTACAGKEESMADTSGQEQAVVNTTEDVEKNDGITQTQHGSQRQDTVSDEQLTAEQETAKADNNEDAELEEKLAVYRAARDDAIISYGNGVTGGSPGNPEDYGFTLDISARGNFDTRDLTEGYAAGKSYVEDVLGFVPETKNTVYMCVDPRIWAIYDAEDKGVANGYEPENIFICEYCDHGKWQYLILVREGKGSAWEVIHHGSSYFEEESN